MSAITDLLEQRAGLGPEKAQEVEQLVLSHVMSRVPPQFQGMLSSALGVEAPAAAEGQPAGEGGFGGLLDEASSLFGKR